MSFTNADPNKFKDYIAEYIDNLILKEAYDKAVLSSKEVEVDNDDFDLDDLFDEPFEEEVQVQVENITLEYLSDDGVFPFPDKSDKFIRDDDDRIDDSNLFNPNNL